MRIFTLFFAIAFLASCTDNNKKNNASTSNSDTSAMKISLPDQKLFHDTIDGKMTELYILKNKNGMTAAVTNFGGRLVGLWVPDKNRFIFS